MGYMHINNLYADPRILAFKRVWASEKVHGCLKKGTSILVASREEKPIEQIKMGDKVISFDSGRKRFCEAEVDAVILREGDPRIHWVCVLLESGRQVICTEDHPFLTSRGWVPAIDLQMSDDLVAYD